MKHDEACTCDDCGLRALDAYIAWHQAEDRAYQEQADAIAEPLTEDGARKARESFRPLPTPAQMADTRIVRGAVHL